MAPHVFLQLCIRSFCQGVVCFRRMRTGACGVARRFSPTGRPEVPNDGNQRPIAVMVHTLLARRYCCQKTQRGKKQGRGKERKDEGGG